MFDGIQAQTRQEQPIVVRVNQTGVEILLRPMQGRVKTYAVWLEGDDGPIGYIRNAGDDVWVARGLGSGRKSTDQDAAPVDTFFHYGQAAKWVRGLAMERDRRSRKNSRIRQERQASGKISRRSIKER